MSLEDDRARLDRVMEQRRRVAENLDLVRSSLDRELTFLPKRQRSVLPLIGLAIGLALAVGRRREPPSAGDD